MQLQIFLISANYRNINTAVSFEASAEHNVRINMSDFKELSKSRVTDILDQAFHIKNNFVDAGNGCVMPQRYREISDKVKNFKVRSDDVFLCSYPRTGSTWLQEILWLLGNDLDYEAARRTIQQIRSPTLELTSLFSDDREKAEFLK